MPFAHLATMKSPILWQNSDRTVTLLDIPQSIASAQALFDTPPHLHLVSSAPPLVPFPTNEPKSASIRATLERNSVHPELHAEYKALLEQATSDVKRNHEGKWCLPRPFVEENPRTAKKRRLENDTDGLSVTSLPDSSQRTPELPDRLPITASHRNMSAGDVLLRSSTDGTRNERVKIDFFSNGKNNRSSCIRHNF